MNLTGKLQELFTLIERNNVEFLFSQLGDKFLNKGDKKLLKDAGIDVTKIPRKEVVDNLYKFGIIAESLGDERTKNLNLKGFKKFIADRNFVPLNTMEQEALDFVKHRIYNDIKGLTGKTSQNLSRIMLDSERKKAERTRKIIADKTQEAILYRKDQRWLSSEIANATGDYLRNFDRIANYVLHEAYARGRMAAMLRKSEGEDVKVFFKVHRNACKYCKGLYLESNGTPKVFDLSTLISNGDNIGRKAKDWKPVVGSVHPNCRCEIFQVRIADKRFKPQEKQQRNVLRERGVRVKVKVG